MPAVQTAYTQTIAPGFVGNIVHEAGPPRVVSKAVQVAALPYGAVALRGTVDHGVIPVGGAGAGGFLGIAVAHMGVLPNMVAANPDQYNIGDIAAIMEKGTIWVNAAVAVADGDAVYYTSAGLLTNVSTSNTLIPNATFEMTTAAAGLTKLKIS